MAALVAVMIVVAVSTFDWHSVQRNTLRRMPKSETTVMLSTVAVVVLTHNLAIGVIVGVLVAMVLFARRVAHLTVVEDVEEIDENTHLYAVRGALFFATSNDLYAQFDYVGAPKNVIIDLTHAQIWDASTVAALDAVQTKFESKGKNVEIVGLDEASAHRHGRLSGHLGAGH
jgi:SulP family sulfate permease